jgi:hypothetical protein
MAKLIPKKNNEQQTFDFDDSPKKNKRQRTSSGASNEDSDAYINENDDGSDSDGLADLGSLVEDARTLQDPVAKAINDNWAAAYGDSSKARQSQDARYPKCAVCLSRHAIGSCQVTNSSENLGKNKVNPRISYKCLHYF